MLTSKSVQEFLDETASSSPAPGGGSVSALAAALGAALTSMVCRLTIGKKKYANVQGEMEEALKKSEELRTQFTALIDEDTRAFNMLMSAFAMPKETDEQKAKRSEAIQGATKVATLVPLKLMRLCVGGVQMAKVVAEKGNVNSISDAGVASLLYRSACEGALFNVRINIASIEEKIFADEVKKETEIINKSVQSELSLIVSLVNNKL